VEEFVPICCFCSMVRDDRNREVGKGPWMNLSTYAKSRQLSLSHRFVFSHGYCPDCVAHFDERLAAYRQTTVRESLTEAARRLIAGADRELRKRSGAVSAVEDVSSGCEEASGLVRQAVGAGRRAYVLVNNRESGGRKRVVDLGK